jgi:hypothetical protein
MPGLAEAPAAPASLPDRGPDPVLAATPAPPEAVTTSSPAGPAPRRSLAEDSAALALAVEAALRDEIVQPHEDPTEGMSRAEITALLS